MSTYNICVLRKSRYSKIPLLGPLFVLPKSGLIGGVVFVLNIKYMQFQISLLFFFPNQIILIFLFLQKSICRGTH